MKQTLELKHLVDDSAKDPFCDFYRNPAYICNPSGDSAGEENDIMKFDSVYSSEGNPIAAIGTNPGALACYIGISKFAPDAVIPAGTCGGIQRETDVIH